MYLRFYLRADTICFILALGSTLSVWGDPTHQIGQFQVTLDVRSPFSSYEMFHERGYEVDKEHDYSPGDFTMNVIVPEEYRPDRPFGLLVFIPANDSGGIPNGFKTLLGEFNLIAVSVRNAGNKTNVFKRYGTALDAVEYLKKTHTIDTDRVIVSGFSGGGRSASAVAILYPEVFTGGAYYLCGCNFYKKAYQSNQKTYYRGFMEKEPDQLELAQSRRFVFHTGSEDFNRENTQVVHNAYQENGFEHTLYLEDEGMGHSKPPAESLRKGLTFLDAGLKEKAVALNREGETLVRAGDFNKAYLRFIKAKMYGNERAGEWLQKMADAVARDTEKALAVLEKEGALSGMKALEYVTTKYPVALASQAEAKRVELEADPGVQNERKAEQIFRQIQAGYRTNGHAKTVEYLQQLIETYPQTTSAQQAEQALKKLTVGQP